jgi:hypothetical protein
MSPIKGDMQKVRCNKVEYKNVRSTLSHEKPSAPRSHTCTDDGVYCRRRRSKDKRNQKKENRCHGMDPSLLPSKAK